MSPRLLPGLAMALLLSALSFADSPAHTIHVKPDGTGDFTTIRLACFNTIAGDTVLVAPGRYTGEANRDIEIATVNIVLMSEAGPAETILDGEGQNYLIYVFGNRDSTTLVKGFTIRNGKGGNGGGMIVYQASPRIENCVFENNHADWNGGGLWAGYGTGIAVSNCLFLSNTAIYRAGGMMADHATVTVSGCVFRNNFTTTGIQDPAYGGGGFQANMSTVLITGCTLAGNSAQYGPGGIQQYGSTVTVEKSIVALSLQGAGVQGCAVNSCVVFANPGGDVLDGTEQNTLHVDPLFCSLAGGDLTLCANSPCLPTAPANPIGQLIGVYRDGCGSCASPVVGTTWGEIKALYR
jgi:hypothetical protein